jgi:hypothetical protein
MSSVKVTWHPLGIGDDQALMAGHAKITEGGTAVVCFITPHGHSLFSMAA